MKEEVEYIVSAIAILFAVGLLSFGFSGLSGYSTKEGSSASVEVSPLVVSPGEYITITVENIGKWGVDEHFSICKENKLCFASGSFKCTGYGCRGSTSVEYRIPSDLSEGTYYAKAYDKNTGEYVRGYFGVE